MKKRRRTLTNRFLAFVMAFSLVAVTFYSDYAVAFASELTEAETDRQEVTQPQNVAETGGEGSENPEGRNVEDEEPDGENPEGENPDGENPEGENPDGENPEGENPEGENPDGENPEGENPDGENPEGENPEGENPDGENLEGENPDGENPDDENSDGVTPEGEGLEDEDIDAEEPEGGEIEGDEGENTFALLAVPSEPQEYTVTYYVDGEFAGSETVTENEGLSLPADPEKEGYRFSGWDVAEGTAVTADMTVNGSFELINYSVKYYDGDSLYADQEYNIEKGLTISFPEDPFKAGYFFMGWKDGENTVQSGSTVSTNMNLTADFQEIKIFEVKVEYYYVNPSSLEETVFDSSQILVEKHDLPATVESPADTAVSADIDPVNPIYYPTETSVQITSADAENIVDTRQDGAVVIGILAPKRVKFIPYEFNYYFTYMLKNLNGQGYTEVDRMEARGIAGVVVTPTVKEITGGVFESAPSALVTTAGQELPVYYTRANYTLHYNTLGGSYIDAVTAPYGSSLTITSQTPVMDGYTFAGWYEDEAYTKAAGRTLTLEADTILYAKWTPKNVNYTIIYQIENANDDGYSYLDAVVKQEKVGTEVTLNSTKADQYAPTGLDKTNFSFKDSTTETIRADGTTVIIVRYSRKVYTLKWNGEIYKIKNNRVSLESSNNGTAQVTAKYGAIITQEWNTNFNDKVNHAHAWNFTKDNNDKFVSIETMPGPDYQTYSGGRLVCNNNVITVYGFRFVTENTQVLRYLLENYESDYTEEYNGKTYGLYAAVTVKFNYLYDNSDWYDIAGYTKDHYQAYTLESREIEGSGVWVPGSGWFSSGHWEYEYEDVLLECNYKLGNKTSDYDDLYVDFYYNAMTYPLALYDYEGVLIQTYDVPFNADITDYLDHENQTAPVEGATWRGWFTDADHNSLYEGNNKMPGGLALYADWTLPKRTITFIDTYTDESTTVEYDYGAKAERIVPASHTGVVFTDWYTHRTEGTKYDFEKPLTSNVTVYTRYVGKTLEYTVRYVNSETGAKVAEPKLMRSPVYTVGQEITERPITVVGMLPVESSGTINLGYENNEIIFHYVNKAQFVDYTVEYVLASDPGVHVAADVQKTLSGSFISVTEAAVAVDQAYMSANFPAYAGRDYYPAEAVMTHEFTAGENVITFLYYPYAVGVITVHYVDMDGNAIAGAEDIEEVSKPGNVFHLNTFVNGYIYHHTEDENGNTVSPSVTIKSGDQERCIYFQTPLTIAAKNKSKEFDGTPLFSEGVDDAEVTGLRAGHALSAIEYDGSQLFGGSSPTTPKNARISGPASSDYYAITYEAGNLRVDKKAVIVTIEADQVDHEYDGAYHRATYHIRPTNVPGFLDEYIQYNGNGTGAVVRKDAGRDDLVLEGQFSLKAAYVNTFDVTFVTGETGYVNITKKALTVTTGGGEKTYDGNALTNSTATISGLVEGETATVRATGSQVTAGSSSNGYEITWGSAKESNYSITEELGTLKVNKRPVTVTIEGKSLTLPYNGREQSVSGHTVTANDRLYDVTKVSGAERTAKGTRKGEYPMGLAADQFENTDENFDVSFVVNDGKLIITESGKVTVTITGHKDTKVYDGTTQQVSGYEVSISTPANVEPYTLNDFTAPAQTIAASGVNAGTYPMGLKASDFVNNNPDYDVQFLVTDGELEITKPAVTVTITGNRESHPYSGQQQSVSGYTSAITIDGAATTFYTQADFTYRGTSTVSGTAVGTYPMQLTLDDFVNGNNNFTVTFVIALDGQLTIEKLPVDVYITGNSADNITYDGQVHSVNGYTVTSIKSNGVVTTLFTEEQISGPVQDAEVATATRKNAGSTQMALSNAHFASTDNINYAVTFHVIPGHITIKKVSEITINVKGSTATKVYNGQEQSVSGWAVDGQIDSTITVGLKNGYTATASGTNAGTYYMNLTEEAFSAASGNYEKININVTDGYLIIKKATRPDEEKPQASGYEDYYDGASHSITLTGLAQGDTVVYTVNGNEVSAESLVATNVADSIQGITITVSNANYEDIVITDLAVIVKALPVTVTTGSAEKEYDGTALTNAQASISGLITGESATVTATGSQIEVGGSSNTYSIDWGNTTSENYTLTEALGTLTVTKNTGAVTLTAGSGERVYNGTALTNNTVTATGLPEGFTVEGSTTGSQTNVGSSANTVNAGYIIKNAAGEDRTSSFTNVDTAAGTLTVTPATLTITTGSAAKAYDGTAVTSAVANIGGLVGNETATVTATGSQIEVGSSANGYTLEWGSALPGNYTISESLGTLTISANSDLVTLTAPSADKTYDGTALTADGTGEKKVTATGLPEGFKVIATATGSQTVVGSSANVVNDGYTIVNAAGEDRTANFTNRTTVAGLLTVNKATVTITTGGGEKEYDGTALTNAEASITGLIGNETATVTAKGEQIEVGSSANGYDLEWGTADPANYTIAESLGTLTVTANDDPIVLTAPSAEKVYDGTALTADGTGELKVTASGLPEGFSIEATASGSQTDVGESANIVNDGYVIKNADGEDKTANFTEVSKAPGTLTVTARNLAIVIPGAEKLYDGTYFDANDYDNVIGYTVELVDGQSMPVTVELVNATISVPKNVITVAQSAEKDDEIALEEGYIIRVNGVEAAANANFNITVKNGDLVIKPRALTFTSATMERAYNGLALENKEITVTGDSFAAKEGVTFDVTGTQTLPGSSNNEFTYTLTGGADAGNYTIEKVVGTLTVTETSYPLTITSGSAEFTYDGEVHTLNEYEVEGTLMPGDYLVVNITGAIANVADNAEGNNVIESVKVYHAGATTASAGADSTSLFKIVAHAADGDKDVSSCYAINPVNGTIRINPAPLTVKANDAEKIYDGKPVTAEDILIIDGLTYTVDGLAEGQTLTARTEVEADLTVSKAEATRIVHENEVNTSVSIADAKGQEVDRSNYRIIYIPGDVKVTKGAGYALHLVANSATFIVDIT